MTSMNVTIQQYTPMIQYAPVDAWVPGNPGGDDQFARYNDGFMLTIADRANALFTFTGTGVW